MNSNTGSRLERILRSGEFAVSVEVGPPRGAETGSLRQKAQDLKGIADAYNVTDNQTALVYMSSVAGSKVLLEEGLDPVMQMTCRDRNRIGLQSDLLGAWGMGIRNCPCLSGAHPKSAARGKGHRESKTVYDLDSVQLVSLLKGLKDKGLLDNGETLDEPVPFFIGAAWTPLAPPEYIRIQRLAKKIDAGADFIQTQAVFDVPGFAEALRQARDEGLTEKVYILGGVIVPASAGMLEYMDSSVSGVNVPEDLVRRMRSAKDAKKEGIKITLELIEAIRNIEGIKGIHIQAIGSHDKLPGIVKDAGLLPRPDLQI
jgi:methylenetetrahydrofolate reductase (NADPH)